MALQAGRPAASVEEIAISTHSGPQQDESHAPESKGSDDAELVTEDAALVRDKPLSNSHPLHATLKASIPVGTRRRSRLIGQA
jgi:hypothetical protein